MTVSNVLIGLDIVKHAVQFEEKHFENKENACSCTLYKNIEFVLASVSFLGL